MLEGTKGEDAFGKTGVWTFSMAGRRTRARPRKRLMRLEAQGQGAETPWRLTGTVVRQ